ncbi:hypothetical protein PTKIN_Ptkin16aG0034900 [Pterospermum kingtungense]
MQLKIPCTIRQLEIENCGRLEKLSTTLHYLTSLTALELESCPKLISLSNNSLPLNLERLIIFSCPSLVSLSSRGEFPTRLKQLTIWDCEKLESVGQEIQDNSSLETITISGTNINNLPQRLNRLCQLRYMNILSCSNLVSFPESGLPTSNLKTLYLANCGKLQALPHGIHNLNCLEELQIRNCSSVTSFPEDSIPTNLRGLSIKGPNICKPLIEWGLHRLTCLKTLSISNGCPDAVLFPLEQIGMMLPSSLTTLCICEFPKLEILSSKGFQNLTSLEKLYIQNCPNLKSLPAKNMLSSLLQLQIWECPVLKEGCEKEKGAEWSKIAHIPCVLIDEDNADLSAATTIHHSLMRLDGLISTFLPPSLMLMVIAAIPSVAQLSKPFCLQCFKVRYCRVPQGNVQRMLDNENNKSGILYNWGLFGVVAKEQLVVAKEQLVVANSVHVSWQIGIIRCFRIARFSLFFHCSSSSLPGWPFAIDYLRWLDWRHEVWSLIVNWCNIQTDVKDRNGELNWAVKMLRGKAFIAALMRMAWRAHIYFVWLERNSRIYKKKAEDPSKKY